jgi:hypothetical protein
MNLARQNKILQKIIIELQKEIEHLNSSGHQLDIIQKIQGNYSILLNPPSQVFHTTSLRSRSCTFEIKIIDIICILTDKKTKYVWFRSSQKSIEGEKYESNCLTYTGTIESFIEKYEKPKVLLCKISRSAAVNLLYYDLDGAKLRLNISNQSATYREDIPVGKEYLKEIVLRKGNLDKMISFQKIDFRSF